MTLAVSVTVWGCREENYSEGAMMVNSINTGQVSRYIYTIISTLHIYIIIYYIYISTIPPVQVCGKPNTRRPLKILFQPMSGQVSIYIYTVISKYLHSNIYIYTVISKYLHIYRRRCPAAAPTTS